MSFLDLRVQTRDTLRSMTSIICSVWRLVRALHCRYNYDLHLNYTDLNILTQNRCPLITPFNSAHLPFESYNQQNTEFCPVLIDY